MECKFCGSDTRVTDKRDTENAVRRRRECTSCGKRFTTYERVDLNVTVVKKDGRRESYARQKLLAGIAKACEKRPIAVERIEAIVDDIENEIRALPEATSRRIGELVMEKLRAIDDVAYIRFASVYRSFADAKSFERELKALKSG